MNRWLHGAFAALLCLAAGCASSPKAGALAYPNITATLSAGRTIFVDAEAVSLGGGAGIDWTPTKAPQTAGLEVGTAGTVKVDMAGGSTGVSIVVPLGRIEIAVTKVYSTADGTTASGITALY